MPELERYMLSLLADLDAKLRQAVDDFDYNAYTRLLADFCNEDLSAFYFDIRKDVLYCDLGPAAPLGTDTRRAYRSVLDVLFHALVRYAAPVLVFTSEEVWGTRYPDAGSVHLLEWPDFAALLRHPCEGGGPASNDGEKLDSRLRGNNELIEKWAQIRGTRALVTERIEPLRREKRIRSSLEAEVWLPSEAGDVDYEEIFITSTVHQGDWDVKRTENHKCGRCWRHLPEVTADGALCNRCETVLDAQ